jgi:hypothetical protein
MAQKGSQFRAEANPALRTVCAHCGKSIPTEVGHPHPLDAEDRGIRRETWSLVGMENGSPRVFPTCTECYQVAGDRRALSTDPGREPLGGDRASPSGQHDYS